MRSSQVYQPTTTSLPYERNKTWIPSFLSQADPGTVWSKLLVLILALLFALMGLIMIIVGATSYKSIQNSESTSVYITILCVGVLFEIAAVGALVLFYRHLGYYIPFCPGKIARIRKHLQETRIVGKAQYGNSGEPVSAQYCPPQPPVGSSLPSAFTDTSEQQRLMEEKQELSDDTERILEEDRRIVLTPLKTTEDC